MTAPGRRSDLQAALTPAVESRYRIERELGAGGMATVYLAHDVRHDRKVAMKVLHPDLAAAIGSERFLSEIRTTAKLQHPHILPLLDSGDVAGLLYYVMPFVDGETLRARLERERQLSVADALRIAREVADALGDAHSHGIVHRDIKPENILLQGGHALVADFGIALAVQQAGGQRLTQTGLSLGTPQYMSPEQALGERSVDHRTDIYALGAVTYEMLAGEPPFTGPTVQAIVAKLMADEPRALGTLRRSVPPNVDAAVMRALEKLPADRMASAQEFVAALDSDVGSARVAGAGGRRARRLTDPLVVSLAAIALGALAVAGWQWVSAHRAQPEPVVRYPIEVPHGLSITAGSQNGRVIAVTPDGNTVAFLAEGHDGTRRLMVRAADDIAAKPLAGTEGAGQAFFSPDGRWLGFWSAGRLQKIALDSGAPQTIRAMPEPAGAAWTSDDVIVLSESGRRLVTLSLSRGTVRELSRPDSTAGEVGQLDPVAVGDGDHVLYMSYNCGGTQCNRVGLASVSSGRSSVLDVAGVSALGMIDDRLIAVTLNNKLVALPIDIGGARITGPPVPVGAGITFGQRGIAQAALSRSGTLVYVTGTRESEIVSVDSSGGTRTVFGDRRAYGYPRYSPDGRRIAVTIVSGTASDIWIYDVESGTSTRFSSGGVANDRPEWTPDGKRIMYRTDRGLLSSIWSQPADMSAPATPVLASERNGFFEAVPTPDGKAIVYQADTSVADIGYRLLAGDTSLKPIAATSATEDEPRVAPDGRWIAFTTDESGTTQVVVQAFPGPGPRLQVSTNGGIEPVWSRDGRRLFYRGGQKIVAAQMITAPNLAVKSRTPLFDDVFLQATERHANYDVSPDGTRLLLLKSVAEEKLIVARNWDDELRARLRPRSSR
jgi:serine/threonine-protein kinase